MPGIDLYISSGSYISQSNFEDCEVAVIYGYSPLFQAVPGKKKKDEVTVTHETALHLKINFSMSYVTTKYLYFCVIHLNDSFCITF